MTLLDSDGKADAIRAMGCRHPDYTTLIETGTGYGDMPFRLIDDFDRIITLESRKQVAGEAAARLAAHPHVKVIWGSSQVRLRGLIDGPTLFWLDAHEVVDDGRSALDVELGIIFSSRWRHVVGIDDARLCVGRKGWPTLGEIEEWALRNDYRYRLEGDIVWLEP